MNASVALRNKLRINRAYLKREIDQCNSFITDEMLTKWLVFLGVTDDEIPDAIDYVDYLFCDDKETLNKFGGY